MDLADLIQDKRDGRSFADLSRAGDGIPSPQRWQQLVALTPKTFPEPPAIRGIAKALRVTERAVILAAAEGLGFDVSRSESGFVLGLPVGVDDLPPSDWAVIWSVAQALVAARQTAGTIQGGSPVRR